ncbi:MAG: hypothetical protein E3J88_03945 [Anaerolineales bacterium]|nr:MAG: hypothetical protein E3J88_03945 [Anaerolineales bacterium]
MSEEKNERSLTTIQSEPGFLDNLIRQIRLVLRLLGDSRVNFLLKLLPIGTLVYLVMPDLIPFVFDDAVVIGVGTYIFIELCPEHVVEEHRKVLWGEGGTSSDAGFESEDTETPEEE